MQAETYERILAAFETLGEIGDPALRTIDTENVMEARKQLAWSLRRYGTEHGEGIPTEAAALTEDAVDAPADPPTTYRYVKESFDPEETIDIPEDAVGVTLDSFSDMATVRYLIPEDHE